jgi:hypothetical protein
VNSTRSRTSWSVSSHGIVDTTGFKTIATARDAWTGVYTTFTDTGTCSTMLRNRKARWRTCDNAFSDISPAKQYVLGTPDRLEVTGSLAPSGVDREVGLLLGYDDGRAATLLGTLRHQTPGAARIFGTEGFIEIPPRFHHPDRIVLHRNGADPEELVRPPQGAGYSHELVEVSECLRAGRTESSVMPLADTLAVQRILNEASERLGIFHREDTEVEV